MNQEFYIVDVFAERRYAGNQLAVFPEAGDVADEEMQQLALEMNYSETTFIRSDQPVNGGYDVRIFTPREEVPFAGHPTLGTAFVIRNYIRDDTPDEIILNLKVGQIPVRIDPESAVFWMRQNPPEFGEEFEPETMTNVLSLEKGDLDTRFPLQAVSTGLPFIIVPLVSLDAVTRASVNYTVYPDLLEGSETQAILVFAPETEEPDNDLHVRVFADYYGVPEDPATGSANGCLAGYLAHHRYTGEPEIDLRVEQGYALNRPSLLCLRSVASDSGITVDVGGKVVAVARGELC